MDAPSSSNNDASKASHVPDLENQLRNMIVSNQSKVPQQGGIKEPRSSKQADQSLPPDMRGASQDQQQNHVRNKSNARPKGNRGSLQQLKGSGRGKQQSQGRSSDPPSAKATTLTVNGSQAKIDTLAQDPESPSQDPLSPSHARAVPPHLRGASREVQQQHLHNEGKHNKSKAPESSAPRKRMNQAERRKQQKEQNLLRPEDRSFPEPEPSARKGLTEQSPFSPIDHASFTRQPQLEAQGAPGRYNAVPPPPQFSQAFHPQSPAPFQQSFPNQGQGQSHVQYVNHRSSSRPDGSTGFDGFPPYGGHFERGSSRSRGSRGARGPRDYANQHYARHMDSYPRPQPQQHRLYEPNPQSNFNPHAHIRPGEAFGLLPIEQIKYLDNLAAREIPNATMDIVDLAAKDSVRRSLEELCREAVVEFESRNHVMFDATSVTLECFGSISSGFATVGSDMDLALISPKSIPSTASPESEIPRMLEKVLLDHGYGARLLTQTRVPIIKFCEIPTPELRKALLEKRTQWEKSLLEPPKPKKKKKEPKTTEASETVVMSKAERAANRKKKRTLNKNKKWLKQNGAEIKPIKTDESLEGPETLESNSKAIVTPADDRLVTDDDVERVPTDAASEQDDSDVDAGVESANGDEQAESQIEEVHVNGVDDVENIDATDEAQDQEEKVEKDEEGKPEQPVSKYKAIMRSAEEMIRLYRLAMKEGWFEKEERIIINQFINVFESPITDPDVLIHRHEAREALKALPNVLARYRDKLNDSLEFPKSGVGVQCDINFSNLLAVHNTALLRCYSLCDPRIQQMVIFVKAWAKRRKINTPYRGTLSSYGYVLMVLHYVVNIALPPLAPNLQRHPFAEGSQPTEVDGYDTRFWRDELVIHEAANQCVLLMHRNEESLGSLLRGFFLYYAQQGHHVPKGGFNWTQDALSLRTEGGLLTKREKDWTGAKRTIIESTVAGQDDREIRHRYLLAIEDPFEIDHNVARTVVHEGIVAIRDEFRRAYQIIHKGGLRADGDSRDLFEEGTELPSQRTYFGPKPRPVLFGPNNLAKALRPKDPYGLEGLKKDGVEKVVTHPIGRELVAGTKKGEERNGVLKKEEI